MKKPLRNWNRRQKQTRMMHVRPGAAAIEDHELQKTTKTRTPPPAQRQTLHSRSQPTLLSNCSKASQEMNTSSTAAAAKPRASHELLHSSSCTSTLIDSLSLSLCLTPTLALLHASLSIQPAATRRQKPIASQGDQSWWKKSFQPMCR